MVLRGTGHGLGTADKVKAVAVEYVRKKFTAKDALEVETIQFDGTFYHVNGRYADATGTQQQFNVKLDKDGNVVEV